MVHQTVEAGHKAGIWVGLCGEVAADLAAPILLGLGLDEIVSIPKSYSRQLTSAVAEAGDRKNIETGFRSSVKWFPLRSVVNDY